MPTHDIEWATDADAQVLQILLAESGLNLVGGNWTGLGRTWLVARGPEGILACLAYHPGRPFARLDFLTFDKSVSGLSKARIVRDILEAAFGVASLHGSSFVTGMVPYYLPEYGEFLTSRGGKQINDGWLFCAALNEVRTRRKAVDGRRIKINDNANGHADR